MNLDNPTDVQSKQDSSLQPWQFFVLAALGCATAVTFLVRSHGVVPVMLLSVMMATTALVGLAVLRVVRPLVTPQDDRGAVVGQRLRVLLEQDKALALRTIKELEFDRAMGKISEQDFHEMSVRLRARATRLMKQLDAGGSYRAQVERDLAKRLGDGWGEIRACESHVLEVLDDERLRCEVLQDVRRETVNAQKIHAIQRTLNSEFAGLILCVLCVLRGGEFVRAQIQMPDPKQMSGIPRPDGQMASGTVTVRLIRGDLSNNITGHPVELHVGDKVQTVNTDDQGRAEFTGLTPGTTATAVAVVDGERLESQAFPVQTQGGVRLMLVATDKEKERQKAEEAKLPPISGQVVIGGDSRIVMEPGEETISVFYILEIMNTARAPVNPTTPFLFDVPKDVREHHDPSGIVAARHEQRQSHSRGRTVSVREDHRSDRSRSAARRRYRELHAGVSGDTGIVRGHRQEGGRYEAVVAANCAAAGHRRRGNPGDHRCWRHLASRASVLAERQRLAAPQQHATARRASRSLWPSRSPASGHRRGVRIRRRARANGNGSLRGGRSCSRIWCGWSTTRSAGGSTRAVLQPGAKSWWRRWNRSTARSTATT